MILWHLANTTVRSPFRLRDGILLILREKLQGNFRGEYNEKVFCYALSDEGLVSLKEDATYSIGRKWRSALSKMGFLYPTLTKEMADIQSALGPPDYVTDNGLRLAKAETVSEWQECFLRAIAAYYIPSVIEPRYSCDMFSPLRHTLSIMLGLHNKYGESWITFQEMALFIQTSTPNTSLDIILDKIQAYRLNRKTVSSKKRYFEEVLTDTASGLAIKSATLKDYADVNLRYLKATGLVVARGKGIVLNRDKLVLIERLVVDTPPANTLEQLKCLCSGSKLPIDDLDGSIAVLYGLIATLSSFGVAYEIDKTILTSAADLAVERHSLEGKIKNLKELTYAANQASSVPEIVNYLELLIAGKKAPAKDEDDENAIEIPQGEAPAYFEWTTWRAFLAVNSLVNKPWDARRFQVDDNFLPVAPAPGGGPDMIFEFADFVLVVEVTLTASSRQEAAEGEPVRRHVAKYVEQYSGTGKQVFGLFMAVSIDTNTANTFRLGEWYLKDDSRLDLHIVPLTLLDFKELLKSTQTTPASLLPRLKELLKDCRMHANKSAPDWKSEISVLAKRTQQQLSGS